MKAFCGKAFAFRGESKCLGDYSFNLYIRELLILNKDTFF